MQLNLHAVGLCTKGVRVCWLVGTIAYPRETNRTQKSGGRVLDEDNCSTKR